MDNQSVQRIEELLEKNDNFAIAVGKNPSLDEMGAALALFLSLKQNGKQIIIASPTEPIVAVSSLVGIDKVQTNLGLGGGDLIVSFPYKDREIEKVSYTLEEGYLNIVVKPSGSALSFSEKDVKFRSGNGSVPVLFIIGTPRLSDLGNLFDTEALKDTIIINIDNKGENQGFGDVVLVSNRAASVSGQVAQLLSMLQLPLDQDIAQNLLSGITQATNNFQSLRVDAATFEITASLMKKGASRPRNVVREQPQETQQQDPFIMSQQRQVQQPFGQQRQNKPFLKMQQQFSKPQQPKRFVPQQPTIQPQPQMPQQPQPMEEGKQDEQDTPPDWLTPKVYKGSTLV